MVRIACRRDGSVPSGRNGGRTYRATSPELVNWADGRSLVASAFNPMLRAGLRALGIRQFMRLHVALTD
jgi:hypothetical protein